MNLIKTFLFQEEAESFISKQKKPRLGDYFIEKDIFTGKFNVYLTD
tara:strand:- start:260 stop:397 length:138 start_codon:yes stop_codon:yes gene_type:complete